MNNAHTPLVYVKVRSVVDACIRGMTCVRVATKQARHAGTLGSSVDAVVLGVYAHSLLLSTGSILVPVVAHAVFDAILFVAGHLNVRIFYHCCVYLELPLRVSECSRIGFQRTSALSARSIFSCITQ